MVEREEDAVVEELVGRVEVGLRAGRVSDHPELELWGRGVGAFSAGAGAFLHGERERERELKFFWNPKFQMGLEFGVCERGSGGLESVCVRRRSSVTWVGEDDEAHTH